MATAGSDSIVQFYSGGRDAAGRTLDEVLARDDEWLESVHDYIQWLFPTRQPSGVNPLAPLVTDATAAAFRRNAALRERLRRALNRMLTFYGLRWNVDRVEIDRDRFPSRASVWLHPGNHNHLRLTRIMKSVAALGLPTEARALQRCLIDEIADGAGRGRVSTRTAQFWRRAIDPA